ncbi:hypothetical protein ACFPYI_04340 [Halomarina salina]|uniref:DUF8159 domain-containing protein n=1 Tax=Halomarina salina TaxID=1872699 RepID=A0ABD5RJL7_9EURY|nr:hypothetical protein [Halomarina salina]
MNRRRLLQLLGGAGIVGLAGCSASSEAEFRERYAQELKDDDVDIASLGVDEGIVTLEYYSTARTSAEIPHIGSVVGIYAAYVDQGWHVERLNVSVLTESDTLTATYYVTEKMVEKMVSGDLTDREVGQMVTSTIEMKRTGE